MVRVGSGVASRVQDAKEANIVNHMASFEGTIKVDGMTFPKKRKVHSYQNRFVRSPNLREAHEHTDKLVHAHKHAHNAYYTPA